MRSTATMIMVILMVSLLAFGCACKKNCTKADATPAQETVAPVEEAPVDAPAEEAPVDAPAEVPVDAPAEAPVDAPAEAPAEAPAAE